MTGVVEIEKVRLGASIKKGFRNWKNQFKEDFNAETCLSHLSLETLRFLVQSHDKGAFYLYDLIMNLQNLGSGFEFHELNPKEKMAVMDRYLFLLDRIRFEFMKRLGWIEGYPGEGFSLVELITRFDEIGTALEAKIATLSRDHADYDRFGAMSAFEKEEFIRRLIAKVLKKIKDHSTTL
ncbi:MAG: hypothetical protein ABII26_09185 [Pseudomonadota bacterium]